MRRRPPGSADAEGLGPGLVAEADPPAPRAAKDRLGRAGEEAAARLLASRGLKILGRNVRTPFGEIDVLAAEGPTLVVVEVKTRRGLGAGHPAEAVDARRRARLAGAVRFLLGTRRARAETVRFDVVSVLWPPGDPAPRLEHLPAAFDLD